MAPRRTNNNDASLNEWEELRRTLTLMQENIQQTIHDSLRDLTEILHLRQDQDRDGNGRTLVIEIVPTVFDDESTNLEENPFADECPHRRNRGFHHRRDSEDRRWEMGFKVELPEFHGGVRGRNCWIGWLRSSRCWNSKKFLRSVRWL